MTMQHPLHPGGFAPRDRRRAQRLPARPEVTAMGAFGLVRSAMHPAGGAAADALRWTSAVLSTWRHNHAARRGLLRSAQLDPRFARDIGLTDGDIAVEVRKPFWVPVRNRDPFGGRS